MAKTMKKADAEKERKGVDPRDLRRSVDEILRQKELASEYAGSAGAATKNAVENHNLSKKALGIIVALQKADAGKRQETLRAIIEYSDKMGFFDELDLFDDTFARFREIVDGLEKRAKPAADDGGVMAAMLN